MLQSTGMAIAGEGSHAFDYYEDHDYWPQKDAVDTSL